MVLCALCIKSSFGEDFANLPIRMQREKKNLEGCLALPHTLI